MPGSIYVVLEKFFSLRTHLQIAFDANLQKKAGKNTLLLTFLTELHVPIIIDGLLSLLAGFFS